MAARKGKTRQPPPTPGSEIVARMMARLRPYQREIMGGALLLLAVLTLLSLLSIADGSFNRWWASLFSQLFGWGATPATILFGVFGVLLLIGPLKDENYKLPVDVIIGLELLLVVGLTATHLVVAHDSAHALQLARAEAGGGFVGWGVSSFLIDMVGSSLAFFIVGILGLAALSLTFRFGLLDLVAWLERAGDWAQVHLEQPAVETAPSQTHPVQTRRGSPSPDVPKTQKKASPAPQEKIQPPPAPKMTAEAALAMMPKSRHPLPPLDLLAPPVKDAGHGANARYQAQIIEETLYGFGVPAEVVEINRGPTVTQFGLKLGTIERKLPDGVVLQQRVRVRKVVALNNDLALALSAAPIRIEAPVPGRPLVGIEVPNSDKTMVSLRGVLEAESFKKGKGALRIALGKGVSGQAVSASLAEMPHLLIAGATGSGKSVCLNAIIATLLFTHAPEQLRFLMIDPKMVELTSFNGIPHLVAPVVTDFEQVVGSLAWTTREMERRYKLFAKSGARSISGYNQKMRSADERLPYLVVVIDELADLMMLAPDEIERHVCRIAQMARATGIHLVIATQRPSVDVVTGLIKANFPSRIAFAVTSQVDSRVILDTPGAERLLGRGDMLYMASDSPQLARLQGCFVADAEIRNIVNYWKAAQATLIPAAVGQSRSDSDSTEPPWADIVAEIDKDDLLEDAIQLVVDSGRASTSFLQRRLGIGYPRASRLMDQLEEEGVIGPAEGSKPREVLWRETRDEASYDEFEKDVVSN